MDLHTASMECSCVNFFTHSRSSDMEYYQVGLTNTDMKLRQITQTFEK